MPSHRIQHAQMGCCVVCPVCTALEPALIHSEITGIILGLECTDLAGYEFPLVFNYTTNEWESGDLTLECDILGSAVSDVWNIRARCYELPAEPSLITSDCCPDDLPTVLSASISDLTGCPGPWPAAWELTWNGSAWTGTSSGGCDTITLTLTCTGANCNGFRLAISSTCLTSSGNAPTTCACDPFQLTFDQNVGAGGCGICCNGFVLRTFRITITDDPIAGTGSGTPGSGVWVWQWNVSNDCGLATGWMNAVSGETTSGYCNLGLLSVNEDTSLWDAQDCSCCQGAPQPSYHEYVAIVDDIVFSKQCCTCVCDRLCITAIFADDNEIFYGSLVLWQGCNDNRWIGTIPQRGGIQEFDVQLYLEEIDNVCHICLESECLEGTGGNRVCVEFTPDPVAYTVTATFLAVDFSACLTGLTNYVTDVNVSCSPCDCLCGCCDLPGTLFATFTDSVADGCAGIFGTIELTYDSALQEWEGEGTIGSPGCFFHLRLRCNNLNGDCTDFRLDVLEADCDITSTPASCSCFPFNLLFGGGFIEGCDCCDGFPLPGSFEVTITE